MKSLLLFLLLSSPSVAFLFGAGKGLVAMRSERTTNIRKTITRNRTNTTRCWMGKYGKNTPKKTKIDKNDTLSYERSLITEQGYSYILGSDDTGRGSIAGPLVTATCCIMTLRQEGNALDSALNSALELPTVKVLPTTASGAVEDSKQLSSLDREKIYETIVNNPNVYAFSVAQRSNIQIDQTNNIQTTTMEAFQESIENLAEQTLFPRILSQRSPGMELEFAGEDKSNCSGCYSIVDGKKSPKLNTSPFTFPSRPMVKADEKVYTVALASIIAKVTLDRMFQEWHEQYPNYGFNENMGYATKDHIEAIHKYGPCPLHRMTFKSLRGR